MQLSFDDLRFDTFFFKPFNKPQNYNEKIPDNQEAHYEEHQNAGNLETWEEFNAIQSYEF